MGQMAASSGETALDGTYTVTGVPPGTYYVAVEQAGYIKPVTMFAQQQINPSSEQVRALIDRTVPRVTVEQGSTAHVDVQIQRAASVSGTITYDDGAPASRVSVIILSKNENGEWKIAPFSRILETDDRGFFRQYSLMPGTYLIQATLYISLNQIHDVVQTGRSNSFVRTIAKRNPAFYGNGTPYIDQAATFTLHGDEERTGQDMTLAIGKLHKLTGRVAAEADGHLVNAATVELIATISKKSIASTVVDSADDLFHFEFVPEGDYTLRVTNARDVTGNSEPLPTPDSGFGDSPLDKERVLKTYGDVDVPLLLRGDMTGITATVQAKQSKPTAASN
jgi:hypothetical protein